MAIIQKIIRPYEVDITHKQTFESQLAQADQLSVIAEIKSKVDFI